MLGTKKGKWVLRIFAFLLAGVVQYAYTAHAEKRAYNNGYLVAKADAVSNFLKYNHCVTAKDAVTESYQLIHKEVNHEKP